MHSLHTTERSQPLCHQSLAHSLPCNGGVGGKWGSGLSLPAAARVRHFSQRSRSGVEPTFVSRSGRSPVRGFLGFHESPVTNHESPIAKSFPCHTSGRPTCKCFVCHTSKNALPQVLYLPHIRYPPGRVRPLVPSRHSLLLTCHSRQAGRQIGGLRIQRQRSRGWSRGGRNRGRREIRSRRFSPQPWQRWNG